MAKIKKGKKYNSISVSTHSDKRLADITKDNPYTRSNKFYMTKDWREVSVTTGMSLNLTFDS